MINFKDITKEIESILKTNLDGFIIERNPRRNSDPAKIGNKRGWIGIYRGSVQYVPHTTGATPWMCLLRPVVEVQAVSMRSGEEAEDKLQDAEKAVLDVLTANKNLNGKVGMTNGYELDYEFNEEEKVWFHAVLITLILEVRA